MTCGPFTFDALVASRLESQYPTDHNGEECPVPFQPTAVEYSTETNGFDCSLVDNHRLHRPSPRLIDAMNMRWTGYGADFMDDYGTLVAFDPSAHDSGSTALLIREENLARFLDDTGAVLVWRIWGDKRAIVPGGSGNSWAGFLRLTGASVYGPEPLTGRLATRLEVANIDS